MAHTHSSKALAISLGTILTIITLLGGAGAWFYLQAPVVSYSLTGPNSYSIAYDASGIVPLQIAVQAQNTGQTDLNINVTLSAVNATISLDRNSPYSTTLSQPFLFVRMNDKMGSYPSIWVKVNKGVSSFSVRIVSINGSPATSANSPTANLITTIIVSQARYTALAPQSLQYTKRANQQPDAYDLIH